MSKHIDDLRLVLDTHVKSVKTKMPKYGDAFETRVNELQRHMVSYVEKDAAIRTSGRYSPDGERAERRLAARAVREQLKAAKAETVTKLETQLAEQRAAALKPRTQPTDPGLLLLKELRLREMRDHLRSVDPVMLQARIRQAVDDGANTDLLEALEGAPAGFPIAPGELVQQARTQIAEKNHPELGELAQLRDAYTFAVGVTEQALLAASGLTPMELGTDPAPAPKDERRPYLQSTGKAV